jgi:hypothetical protein
MHALSSKKWLALATELAEREPIAVLQAKMRHAG